MCEAGGEEEGAEEAFGWWSWVREGGGFACGGGSWGWVGKVGFDAAEPAYCAYCGCEADVRTAETVDEVAGHVFHRFFCFCKDGLYNCGVRVEDGEALDMSEEVEGLRVVCSGAGGVGRGGGDGAG